MRLAEGYPLHGPAAIVPIESLNGPPHDTEPEPGRCPPYLMS